MAPVTPGCPSWLPAHPTLPHWDRVSLLAQPWVSHSSLRYLDPLSNLIVVQWHQNSLTWCLWGGIPNKSIPGLLYSYSLCTQIVWGLLAESSAPAVSLCPLLSKGSAPDHSPFPGAPDIFPIQGTTCSSHCTYTPSYQHWVYSWRSAKDI